MPNPFTVGDRVRFKAAWVGLVPPCRVGETGRVREVAPFSGRLRVEFERTFHCRWFNGAQQAKCLERIDG
jgi:uncharacterized protein YodC (DUF2158 family)